MTSVWLNRVIVSVSTMDRALAFYRDVLGLTVTGTAPAVTMLALPAGAGQAVTLQLHERPAEPSRAGVAVSLGVDDVDARVAAAVAAGATVLDPPEDRPWGERLAVLTDPDGHVVCLAGEPRGE